VLPDKTNGTSNLAKVPAGVEVEVIFSQLLGIFMTAMIMANNGDAVRGITLFMEGYQDDIKDVLPNATRFRW
jgi:hypothetical protein